MQSQPPELLVVADDPAALNNLTTILGDAGFRTRAARGQRAALAAIREREPALALIEVNLLEGDGLALCRTIRESSDVPVIFLSGPGHVEERVRGLRCGGDDYLVRPLDPGELVARVWAVLRRARRRSGILMRLGRFQLDPVRRVLTLDGQHESVLTPIEFRLLHYLMQNAGKLLTFEQILSDVWGDAQAASRNLVSVYIRRLRAKVEPPGAPRRHIRTVAHQGYRFEI